ncbi:MAG: hypothetical protein NWE94_05725 [Candidatus Bathyarchaeota archaeon]|nr:hypothetical protein [Candidatus Bathyarchaeota archaeon]
MLNSEHEPLINGFADPNFEEIRAEFTKNFLTRGEIGAACAVYHKQKKVVDPWGGLPRHKKDPALERGYLSVSHQQQKGLLELQ